MITRELLRRVGGGLLRRDLYYLESQHLIVPKKYRAGNVWHRDWPEDIIPKLQKYITLKKKGYRVSVAWERAQMKDD